MAMCTVKSGAATAGKKKLRKRIIPAAIEAAEEGRPTMECIQPNRKPQTGLNPRRRYAYSPPASGIAAPSSAKASAPKMDRSAPTTQAAKTMETKRPSRAISDGFRKIPVPTIVPTTIAAEAHGPSPRTSSKRFSLIPFRANFWQTSVDYRATLAGQDANCCSGSARLTRAPTTKVTHEPIKTYHV